MVLLASMWFFAALGLALTVAGPAIESIREDFGVAYATVGLAFGSGGAGYMIGSLAGGTLSDRIGRRTMTLGAIVLAAAGMAATGLSPNFGAFLVSILGASVGFGASDSTINALISDAAGARAARALNLAHGAFAVGALLAPPLVGGLLASGAGWRPAMWVAAALALSSLVPFALLHYPPARTGAIRLADIARALSARPYVLLGAVVALYLGVEVAYSGFGAAYFETAFDLDRGLSAGLVSVFWIGLLAGRVGGAWLAEMWDLYHLSMLSLGLSLAFALVAALAPSAWLAVAAIGLSGLAAGTLFPSVMAIALRHRPELAGAVSGALVALAGVGGFVYAFGVGAASDAWSLRGGLMLVPAGLALALALMLVAWRWARRELQDAQAPDSHAPIRERGA